VLRVAESASWPAEEMAVLRWGRLSAGGEPVAAAAVGFPWAQERPDMARDTEHVVGFLSPAAGLVSGRLQLTVVSAAPAQRTGAQSPWAGMSGAGLLVGPCLVGIVVVDPARYGTDRLVAVPADRLLSAAGFGEVLGAAPEPVAVGAQWRLEYAAGRAVALAAPYRPLPPGFDAAGAPIRLLHPEHGVVPFGDRDGLVGELAGWCADSRGGGGGLRVRTVTGVGGSGKTRLAAEACVAVAGRGWDAGFADADRPGGAVRWVLERPTLLVVDDADLNVGLSADLVESLAYAGAPVRLLMLARFRHPWWGQLGTATDQLLDGFDDGDLPLGAHRLDLPARAEHYHGAYTALAEKLASGVQRPPAEVRPPEPPDLSAAAYGDPLMVHMAALLAAAGEPLAPGRPTGDVRAGVLRTVLDREAGRWPRQLQRDEARTEPLEVLRRCVATATISAPAGEVRATEMLTAVPDLASAAEPGRRTSLARWLHGLQPGEHYWNPIRPDLLADQLLADLDALPEIALGVAENAVRPERPQDADMATLDRLLAELTRAAATATTGDSERGGATEALRRLLRARLSALVDAAVGESAGPLPQRLAAALSQAPVPAEAAAVVGRLPEHSPNLADFAHTLTSQTIDHYRELAAGDPDGFLPDLASVLHNQSIRLADLGRREEALAAANEAVRIRRRLVAARADVLLPDLALGLINQSNRLAALGRREDALGVIQEAVEHFRRLAEAQPDPFLTHLAGALNNQSTALEQLGRWQDALAAIEEAVVIFRRLTRDAPDTLLPHLAAALINQSNRLAVLDRREEALAAIEEAVEHYRGLAQVHGDVFLPDIAMALNNQSAALAAVGRREEALAAVREAVGIRRGLVEISPDAYLSDLARSLSNLSLLLGELGRVEEAPAVGEQAVASQRELAASRPAAFLPDLAQALVNQFSALTAAGRREEALAAVVEGVEHYRALAGARPAAFLPDLARALRNQSFALAAVGRRDEALAAAEEAVRIRRGLVETSPDTFMPDLWRALDWQSIALAQLGRREEALVAISEAIAIGRRLADSRHDAFQPDLSAALTNEARLLDAVGRSDEAVAAIGEAVCSYRELAGTNPSFRLELAETLILQGELTKQDFDAALASYREALSLFAELAIADPVRYGTVLHQSLHDLAGNLLNRGWSEQEIAAEFEHLVRLEH
jgi:tetratricopeptide (TPR) repeat protein